MPTCRIRTSTSVGSSLGSATSLTTGSFGSLKISAFIVLSYATLSTRPDDALRTINSKSEIFWISWSPVIG